MKNLLTVVISTYNRAELLKNNISKMLGYDLDIDFIVGDNASNDGTWEMLSHINNKRLKIFRNEENLDINNVFLLARHVKTRYFMFLNDRDYVEKNDFISLLSEIEDTNYDIISSVVSNIFRRGEIVVSKFYYLYFLSNHPGCLIYNTSYFNKHIDNLIIEEKAKEHDSEFIYNYITSQILMNLQWAYFRPFTMVVQPANRDKITQTRREQYGSVYILPEYHIKAYESRISLLNEYSDKEKIKKILLALYKSSIRKVELEFYVASKSKDFCVRNNCVGLRQSDWCKNGYLYTKNVIKHRLTYKYLNRYNICFLYISETFFNALRILKMR